MTGRCDENKTPGLLRHKKGEIVLKVNGKFYETVVRPATTYEFECWALNKKEVIKMKVAVISGKKHLGCN